MERNRGGALRIDTIESNIALIIAKDYVVTDYQSFPFLGSELGEPIRFDKKFMTQEFDAVTFDYSITWWS